MLFIIPNCPAGVICPLPAVKKKTGKQTHELELLLDWPVIINQLTQRDLQISRTKASKPYLNSFDQLKEVLKMQGGGGVQMFSVRSTSQSHFGKWFWSKW